MGSPERLDYSAVGDSVNVAARLEGLTKEYGVHVIVGEQTRAAAAEAFVYRFLGVAAVKGLPESGTCSTGGTMIVRVAVVVATRMSWALAGAGNSTRRAVRATAPALHERRTSAFCTS
jgi:hypothetical protein